jgi:hypothetical protein
LATGRAGSTLLPQEAERWYCKSSKMKETIEQNENSMFTRKKSDMTKSNLLQVVAPPQAVHLYSACARYQLYRAHQYKHLRGKHNVKTQNIQI